jgi:ABC-type uncharacterized transport system involved in gliding motility auxiliary subunit
MNIHGRRFWSSALGIVAVAAILVGINLISETPLANVQLDLTRQHLYTLSSGTRKVLADLKEPVTLRLYYSRQLGTRLPAYGAYADRVQEMLRHYVALSHGKLNLEVFDPEPFSSTEDHAVAYGLQGVPVDQMGEQVYFGLVGTNMVDDERTIPFLTADRERFLEYDLTRILYELSNPKRAVMGVMSSLPLEGDPRMMMMRQGSGGPWISMQQLHQSFTVKDVPLDVQVIPDDVQVLLVAHAQHLSDSALYAIDQFVMRGGRLMVMVDPASDAEAATPDPATGMPTTDTTSDLGKLFDAWGIAYDPNHVVGDLTGAWRVRANADSHLQAVSYIAWFNIRNGIARDDPATGDLQQVTVASAGSLAKKDGADITFTPLLRSSDKSGLIPVDQVRGMPDPAKILAGFHAQGGPRVIAARVRGVLKSAFAAPPDPPKGQTRPKDLPAYKSQTDGPANLVVVADSDILADRFWVRVQDFFGQQQVTPFSDNGAFVANLVGTLAGGDALIGLRSRAPSLAPFEVVDDMQREAEARFRQTEQALQAHLDEATKKLADLRAGRDGVTSAAVVTEEQRTAIEGVQRDITSTRTKLRAVQLDLRQEISALETRLRILDIAAVPALLTIVAIVIGLIRRRRRAAARA